MKGNAIEYFLNSFSDHLFIPFGEKINDVGIMLLYFINNVSSVFLQTQGSSVLLAKSSFAFLLLSMFFYWFQTTFKIIRQTFLKIVPSLSMWLANITLVTMLTLRWIESGHFPLSNLYESLLFLSWSLTSIHLFLERAFNKKRLSISPGASLMQKLRNPFALRYACEAKQVQRNEISSLGDNTLTESTFTLGAITSPLALFTNAFATFSLPEEMQKVTVLVPALQSNWLIMHVSVMMISYAALLSGSLLAMAFLVVRFVTDLLEEEKLNALRMDLIKESGCVQSKAGAKEMQSRSFQLVNFTNIFSLTTSQKFTKYFGSFFNFTPKTSFPPFTESDKPNYSPLRFVPGKNRSNKNSYVNTSVIGLEQTLDNLSYRSIGLGFAFLTIGILSGAVWANEAWGSYWSWDPKETWAFVTWLVFALYLHTRISRGWVGKESASVATFGFLVIWFCYLGVNIFGTGLHSYGWFSTS